MSTPTGAIRAQLMASSPEYQHLSQQHAQYAAMLDQLASRRYLNEQEQLEETRLKKLKLRLKDQMETLAHRTGTA